MHGFWTKNKVALGVATVIGGCYIATSGYVPILFYFYSDKINGNCNNSRKPVTMSSTSSFLSWSLFKKNDSPLYWKLLKLAGAKNENVRHIAVKALTEMTSLDDSQCRIIAQACETEIAIRLARTTKADPRFFLPPPFRDLKEGNMEMELHNLLQSLPSVDGNFCLELYTKRALSHGQNVLDNIEFWFSEFEGPESIYHFKQKRDTADSFEKDFLQAVLGHSAISSHKQLMIEKGILKLFHKILLLHENEVEFKSLIAQILANLSMEENSANQMHSTGWIGILSQWINSPHIEINLPAAKALANLDKEFQSDTLFDNGVYLLHPQFREREQRTRADVVFVHGLLGSAFYTWRQHDSKNPKRKYLEDKPMHNGVINANLSPPENYTFCWPKDWLAKDIPHIRVVAVNYSSCISNWKSKCPQKQENDNLDVKAYELMRKLVLAGIGKNPVIWVAHSMGGLLVKQMLIEAARSTENEISSLAKNTAGIVFCSVPHKGAELASMMQTATFIFQPSIDIQQLGKDSPQLDHLHKIFETLASRYNYAILSFGETKESKLGLHWRSVLVSSDSSNPGFGEFHELPVEHLDTCKPYSDQSFMYTKLLNFLKCVINPDLTRKTV